MADTYRTQRTWLTQQLPFLLREREVKGLVSSCGGNYYVSWILSLNPKNPEITFILAIFKQFKPISYTLFLLLSLFSFFSRFQFTSPAHINAPSPKQDNADDFFMFPSQQNLSCSNKISIHSFKLGFFYSVCNFLISQFWAVAMDCGRKAMISVLLVLLLVNVMYMVKGNVVFEVHHKYGGRGRAKAALSALREHDSRRHGRMLASIDFQLRGDGSFNDVSLYYTKITIGTPPVDYHVQVDTGSDILWVNCQNCERCPTKSDLHIPLKKYDLLASSTGETVSCDQDFCAAEFDRPNLNCKVGMNCEYIVAYGDGSRTEGYFVRDYFKLDQVTGNLQTSLIDGSIAFGCSAKQSGGFVSSSGALDGIIGFGQSNTSILSQLASSGKVKKIFSHCLNRKKGSGIFAIGEVVQPKVNRTKLVPNQQHYNVVLKGVEVGGQLLNLPYDLFDAGLGRRAILDSGTTLAYLTSEVYQQLLDKIIAQQPDLKTYVVEQRFTCFLYNGNIDYGFPVVGFHFEDSISLPVYPHDYLFQVHDKEYCIGWQNSKMHTKSGREITLLGDIVLSDKLILYDLENQNIGWAEYDCSSSILVRDEVSGDVYSVGAHSTSSALCLSAVNIISFLLLITALLNPIE